MADSPLGGSGKLANTCLQVFIRLLGVKVKFLLIVHAAGYTYRATNLALVAASFVALWSAAWR